MASAAIISAPLATTLTDGDVLQPAVAGPVPVTTVLVVSA
jgi:hypothetical protein